MLRSNFALVREPTTTAITSYGIPSSCVIEPSSLPNNFTCSICQEMVQRPVIAPCCANVFCQACLSKARASSGTTLQCPFDRKLLPSTLPLLKDSNPLAYRIWNGIRLRCAHAAAGCEWTGTGEDFASHQAECKSKPSSTNVPRLEQEIDRLRSENLRIRTAMESLDETTSMLRRENHSLQLQLDEARSRGQSTKVKVDPHYHYNQFRVIELTQLILQDLGDRPFNISTQRIYQCIENILRDYHRGFTEDSERLILELQALLGVCLASTWFTYRQRERFREWMIDLGE